MISKPANSTLGDANWNFNGFRVMPCWPQRVSQLHAWWKLSSMVSAHRRVSSTERPPTSPTPPAQLDNVDSNGPTPAPQPTCSCPRRTKPPPAPSSLPFPATPENRVKLQEYILKHYAASTFNTCEYQVLPLMDGPLTRSFSWSLATSKGCEVSDNDIHDLKSICGRLADKGAHQREPF